jgi:monovalent cation:H+ antiporter-2, CPA2 family
VHILPMIGAMTIITTFLSPYIIRLGWKASNMLNHERADKSAADTRREEVEEADRPEK